MTDAGAIPEVDASTGRRLVDEGATLLDVREQVEWAAGHAPDATLLPLARIAEVARLIPAGARVVVICRSGNRSRVGTEVLLAQGFEAVNLIGGMQAWAAAGEPVLGADGQPGEVI